MRVHQAIRNTASKTARFAVVALCAVGVLYFAAWLVRPTLPPEPEPIDPQVAADAVAAREANFDPDPAKLPTLHRHVHVEPKGESPILAEMVEAGELPPLKDRLPKDPVVLAGVDGIGNYGGTWMRVTTSESDLSVINSRLSGAYLVRWSPRGYPIEPHIARSLESSADKRVWTIKLRPGLKWSDGVPYTADDILYYWDCEVLNPIVIATPPAWARSGSGVGRCEKVNDFEVRFTFEHPNPLFPERLASRTEMCDRPAHYLRQYHPDPAIGDAAVIARDMTTYRMPSPRALYGYIKSVQNPEHPRMWPWIYRTYKATPPHVFVRNPYYYIVDTAGNQLPYIDRMQFDLQDTKMIQMTLANGGVSMQTRFARFQDYTELVSRSEHAGTDIYQWYSASRTDYVINPNLNRHVAQDDPSTKWKAQLLADKRFRQALSLAIDRQRIIRGSYSGVGEPSQVSPGPLSPFYNEAAAKAFTQHDPARADALLDEIGLTQRDYEGFRTFPDGTRMTFYIDSTDFTGIGPSMFVVDDWAKVGVRAIGRERNRPLFYVEKNSRDFDFNVWTGEGDYAPQVYARYFVPTNGESFYAVGWGQWYDRGGMQNLEESHTGGAVPVPKDSPMYEAMTLYDKLQQAANTDEQKRLMNRILDIAGENVWSIGLVTSPPQVFVVSKDMRNVPRNALYSFIYSSPANAGIETYYFGYPRMSTGAAEEVRQSLLRPTLRPGGQPEQTHIIGRVLRWLFLSAGLLVIVMVAVKHPFVQRRLLIMLPTLAIISVIVFTIIQLPPGDFLASKIMEMQASGDISDLQTIEDLKQMFHYEDPMVVRYARWMGLRWFVTFNPADTGLLQGDLGRSMETSLPVNGMVGDRLLLTVLISLGTIALTWTLAIPIGIYSAVKQYTIGDYVLTLIGFIGMCIPAFLLALVLMAVSDVQGLFSPRFAAQPEWSWAKFVDLLKHIWIPIIVLGIGGTASMIRIMRANLLDELRKPYVVTARAKGVRPIKLLLKYPVRIAINPFVSGIGALFPQMVSGGAVVAMVLALPTIGPLLLSALFSEDMYLAGSMLVLLSMLGVVGTLVSDLLLLWLDPRIRFEGGGR